MAAESVSKISIPVDKGDSLIFATSGVKVKSAELRVGTVVISYAFPTYESENYDEPVMLDFFGSDTTMLHTALITQKCTVDIEYYDGGVPSLKCGSNPSARRVWDGSEAEYSEPVIVTNKKGERYKAMIVYVCVSGACALRDVTGPIG